jgi:2-iminoacetate synthase ThiH
MKQTAVEWLLQKLFETNNNTNDAKKMDINKIIEQAKEIEKQQIKDAYISGMYDAHSKTSIDYYKENYETTV